MRDFHAPERSLVLAVNGMAATSHPLASQVAIELLRQGGNAVDAAIGAAVLLGICEPHMTGLGGDCFVLLKRPGSDEVIGLNGSGPAPRGFDAERLRAAGHTAIPLHSADAVTVPGAVDAFVRMARDHGRLGLDAVLAPAIRYAEEGVPVAPRVAFDWAAEQGALQGAARDLFLSDGQAPRQGQIFRAPRQAALLRRIAKEGRAGFYEGPAAEDMVAALRAAGGSHTLEDFAAAETEYVTPIRGPYRGTELIELPPNGQGATALLMARILERFEIATLDPTGAARIHLEAEAAKLAYDARDRFIGDPALSMRYLDHMLSDDTAEGLAALIDPGRAMQGPAALTESVHRDTVYLTVVDRDRMAVSLIYSLFHAFGSGIAAPGAGILFQNRGAGFTLAAGHPNEAGPGKRPMHTIIPAMLAREGRVLMPFGVMGGQYQAAGHVRFLSNMLDFGMDPQQAINHPRSFPQDGALRLERGYPAALHAELAALGHRIEVPDGPMGGAQAIAIDDELGILVGASDPRKDGCALGY
ncbi:gamma-glutamyltransferase family protein [Halovulum dunhuangense]|uniref:Gamma-glutamyltransferase family protein n=1 Tax=Halovulum dunhuangense TaxID=1505036 RepID=A0A849KQ33_9RHOB|nr:gamma-glutamyltransferase family protein [Halovulum dunhuangense]NNU79173.1 gamma-glutamyltransferase family protein [Halovulum dunhuangense]